MMPMKPPRPFGVTILAVLCFLEGIFMFISAMTFASMFGFLFMLMPGLGAICMGVFILLGIFYLLVGFGLWSMMGWARTMAIVLACIGLINIPIGTIIGIIILIYLYKPEVKAAFGQGPPPMMYAAVAPPPAYGAPAPGYGQAPPPAYGAPAPGYGAPQGGYSAPPGGYTAPPAPPTYAPPAPAAPANCRYCGAQVPPGSTVCPRCGGRL
jgi:hypothetical protein